MAFFSSRFTSLSSLLAPATNSYSVVLESPGTYILGQKNLTTNGDAAGLIEVQASNYNGTTDATSSWIAVNKAKVFGRETANKVAGWNGRGIYGVVLNPDTLEVVTYFASDTYGTGNSAAILTALQNVATGQIVVMSSFDATSMDATTRSYLVANFGGDYSNTWVSTRTSFYFIGFKGGSANSSFEGWTTATGTSATISDTVVVNSKNGLGNLTEFMSLDIYAWGAGGGNAYGAPGGAGALVKIGGIVPPEGSTLEVSVGNAGLSGASSQGASYTSSSIQYYTSATPIIQWSDFLKQFGVWNGNGTYTWKAYFPSTGAYDFELSIDDYGTLSVDDTVIVTAPTTVPSITTTLTITADGAGGGGGGYDAGTPGHAGYAGTRVTGTTDVVLGQDSLQINIGTGGGGGADSTGGGRGSRGDSLDYILFNLRTLSGNYGTSHPAYNSWLNSYGVWESNNSAGSFDRTYTVNFPFTGYYLFRVSCDNTGYVYLDGTQVATAPSFGTYYDHNVYVTAGDHTVRTYGVNSGGPASLGVVIYKASFAGGAGGAAGNAGSSGAGGGGGGATLVRKNNSTFLAVAAGGGGGGGAGNGPIGQGVEGTGQNALWYAGAGADRSGDGGGGGGGGGGVQGGKGANVVSGWDRGGYSGEPGSSYSAGLSGAMVTAYGAGNGGNSDNGAWSSGDTGGNGRVVISYTSATGNQLYTGGTVTQNGSTFTHTFTSSGTLTTIGTGGWMFNWTGQSTITEGWHTIKIAATNTGGAAGAAGRIKLNSTGDTVWTSRYEKDPTNQGAGLSYYGGPSTYGTEGSSTTLTDGTATGWMIGRHVGYTTSGATTYSITREVYINRVTNYVFNYMVARAGGTAVSTVNIKVDGATLGTATTVGGTPNTFTVVLTKGFHTIQITGNHGAGVATNVYAALEAEFANEIFGLPLYSLYNDYVSRTNPRGGRGSPSYDSDGDGDGPFSGGDGGGASVVRMNGTYLVIAGAGGGAGGCGDDYWTDSMQNGGGGRVEGNPLSGGAAGAQGATAGYYGGAGGGGGGLTGGAGGAASSTHYPGNGGQGGTSFVNRRFGTDWSVIAASGSVAAGSTDVAFKAGFGGAAQHGRVVLVFQRKPHVWQKINGVWKRFENIYVKKNSSKSEAILNLNEANWIAGANAQAREYTSVATMGAPNTNAIGSIIGVFGLATTGSAEVRTLTSREKINLSKFTNLWYQVNMGTTTNWGEVPDSGENLKLQYSLDNVTWQELDSIAPALAANTWTSRSPVVPGAAKTADGVYLRFFQSASYDTGYAVRDTWGFTSILGLAALGDAPSAGRGNDIWKNVTNVWVKVQGVWRRIYTLGSTSTTATPTRYG